MRLTAAIVATGFVLVGCANGTDESASSADEALNGEAAYEEHCAGCHETGMLGAPREGEPIDWEERSNLWQAVLMEHANTGYFDMPAKGGKSDLPDDVVNAAAEYMLEQTFPNRPED